MKNLLSFRINQPVKFRLFKYLNVLLFKEYNDENYCLVLATLEQ